MGDFSLLVKNHFLDLKKMSMVRPRNTSIMYTPSLELIEKEKPQFFSFPYDLVLGILTFWALPSRNGVCSSAFESGLGHVSYSGQENAAERL